MPVLPSLHTPLSIRSRSPSMSAPQSSSSSSTRPFRSDSRSHESPPPLPTAGDEWTLLQGGSDSGPSALEDLSESSHSISPSTTFSSTSSFSFSASASASPSPSPSPASEQPFSFLDPYDETRLLEQSESGAIAMLHQTGVSCQWLMLRCGMSLLRLAVRRNQPQLVTELLQSLQCRTTDRLHHLESSSAASALSSSSSSTSLSATNSTTPPGSSSFTGITPQFLAPPPVSHPHSHSQPQAQSQSNNNLCSSLSPAPSLIVLASGHSDKRVLLLLLHQLDIELELQARPFVDRPEQVPQIERARSHFGDVERLSLKQAQLADVPLSVFMLFPHLLRLDLHHNPLLYLHPAVGHLKRLRALDLRATYIEILPQQLGRLTRLAELRLPRLRFYPELDASQIIQDLGGIGIVDVKSKRLSNKDALHGLPGALPNPEMVVVVLGERGSGKSGLIAKILGKEKSVPPPDHGFVSSAWALKETTVKLWDFGVNKTLDKFALPSEAVYVVTFNLARELSQAKLDYWLQLIRAAGTSDRQPPFILVGTHRDLFESGKNDPEGQLEVIGQFLESKFPRRRFLGNVCPLFSVCTSADESKGQKHRKQFKTLRVKLESLVKGHPFQAPVPVEILNVGRALYYEASFRLANSLAGPMMNAQELSAILRSHGLLRSVDLDEALHYLSNSGRIFYFSSLLQHMQRAASRAAGRDHGAQTLIVLDVPWFAQKLSRTVAQIEASAEERGIFVHDRIRQWTESDAYFCRFALPLMQSLGVAHPLPHAPGESGRSLLADLLPAHKPPRISQLWPPQAPPNMFQFARVFQFRLTPVGLFPRFLSWVLQLPDVPEPEDTWKTGILLCRADGHQVLVTFNEGLQQLTVEVRVPCAPPRPPRKMQQVQRPSSAMALQKQGFGITPESSQEYIDGILRRLEVRKLSAVAKSKRRQLKQLEEQYLQLRVNLVAVLNSLENHASGMLTMTSVLEERINEAGRSILDCKAALAALPASSLPAFTSETTVEFVDEYLSLLGTKQEEATLSHSAHKLEAVDEQYEEVILALRQLLAVHGSPTSSVPAELIEERISSARLAQNQCRLETARHQPVVEVSIAEEPASLSLPSTAYDRSLDTTSLMQQVILVVEQLLECYFPATIPTLQRRVACSHCLNRRDPTAPTYFFTVEDCLEAIHEGRCYLCCCGISTRRIHLVTIVPDLYFSDMPSINPALLEITSKLGAGGYGIVWRGFLKHPPDPSHPDQDRTHLEDPASQPILIAVKEMLPESSSDTARKLEQFSEFRNEVFMHSALRHPHIVHFYGVSLTPRLRMVLELCDGPNLYQLLHDQERWPDSCFPAAVRVRYAHNIASAMTYLHSQAVPIVHCDLRSPNVFLTTPHLDQFIENAQPSDFVAKVADFGLARKVFTSTSGYLGTWQWLPPEITLNSEFTEKADVYSFAIIMWELFSRKYPFEDNPAFRIDRGNGHSEWDVPALKQAICYENLRPLIPPLPLELEPYRWLMEVSWRTSPEERPHMKNILANMSALCRSLGSFADVSTYDRMMEISVTPQPFQPDPIDTMIRLTSVTEVADLPLPKEEEFTWEQVVSDDGLKLKASSDPSRMSLLCALPAPDLDELLVGYGNGEVGRISTRDWSLLGTFTVSSSRVYDIIRVDGSFWICSEDSIRIYDPRLLLLLATVSHKGTHFQQVCLSASPLQPTTPSPVRAASSSSKQGAVMVWASSPNTGSLLLINSKSYKIKHTLQLPIEYSPTALLCVEQTMWVGTIRGVILIYDLATRHVVNSAQIGDTRINKMIRQTVNDPKANVWICSNDASILVYSPTGAPLRSLSGHTGKSRALATAGNYVWSGAFSGRILVFDFSTFRCLECWLEKNEEVSLIEFSSPDRIVIGYRNGVLRIYSINLFGTDFANLPAFSGSFGSSTGSFSGFSGFSGFSASQSNLTTLATPTLASPVHPDSLASPGPSEPPSLPKEKKSIVSRIFGRK